jgi:hypothetical protein
MKKIIVLCFIAINLFAISSQEIVKKNYETTSGFKSSISKINLILINNSGTKSKRIFKSKILEQQNGNKNLIEFIYPKDILGTKLLTYEFLHKSDKQWLYLSAIKRTKKIANNNKSSSFMGSEFTYEDIVKSHYEKYIYKNEYNETLKLYIITRMPKDSTSGYKKQIMYINKKSFLLEKIEYFNQQNRLFKVCDFNNYREQNNIYSSYEIHMKNILTKKESLLITKEKKIFTNLKEKEFSKMALGE